MGWASNVFPLLIITASGGFTGLFVYNPAPGHNNLVDSIAATGGTDPYGNVYQAGITSYPGGGSGTGTYSQLSAGTIQIASSAFQSAPVHFTVSGSLGASAGMSITSGVGTEAGAAVTTLELGDSGAGTGLQVVDGADGNTYDTERLMLHGTALPQSISSVTPTTITGCSKTNLGLRRYRYVAYISFHGAAAAGTARFCIAGTLVTSSFDIAAMFITNTGVANNGTSATFGSGGFVQSPTLTTGANIAYIEGEFVVGTAGSVLLQAFEGTTGDAFTVDNCKFDLFPVVAS